MNKDKLYCIHNIAEDYNCNDCNQEYQETGKTSPMQFKFKQWEQQMSNSPQTLEEKLQEIEQQLQTADHLRTILYARQLRAALVALDAIGQYSSKEAQLARAALGSILGKSND